MNSNVTSSIRISGPVKSFIILGIFFCCLLLFFILALLPKNKTLNSLKIQFEAGQEKLDSAKNQFADLPAIEKKLLKLKSEYSAMEKKLPDDENIPEIIKQLSGELGKLDIKLISLVPEIKKASGDGEVNETTIEILMQSTYRTLGDYLEAIENLPLLSKVQDVAMEAEGIGNLLTIRLVLATYNLGN